MRLSPFLLLCVTGLFGIFSTTMSKTPVLPLFAKALGATEGDIGFIAAASTVVGIVTSLPAGVMSDLYGRRRVILVSAVLFASAPFLYLLVQAPWQLVLVRIYHGFSTAIFGPVAMAMVADLFSSSRGERMGWYSSATLIGRFVAPLVGGFVLFYGTYSWVYLVCGVGGVLALASALSLPKDRPRAGAVEQDLLVRRWREMLIGLRQVIGNRAILVTSATEALQYFSFGALETFLPLYAVGVGLETWQIGVVFGVQLLTTTLMKPILGRASDKMGRRPMIIVGLLTSGLAMALVPTARGFLPLVLVSIIFGLGLAVVTSSTSAYVSELAKAGQYGSALGVLSSIMDIGHASGPIVMGLLVATWGYAPAFVLVTCLLALGSAFFAIMTVRRTAVPA